MFIAKYITDISNTINESKPPLLKLIIHNVKSKILLIKYNIQDSLYRSINKIPAIKLITLVNASKYVKRSPGINCKRYAIKIPMFIDKIIVTIPFFNPKLLFWTIFLFEFLFHSKYPFIFMGINNNTLNITKP